MVKKAIPIMPVGIESFAEIRRSGAYYVDKTGFIEELRENRLDKVTLIARPRRFGKTLMMDTLAEFFDITKDSRALFAGLKVSGNKAFCDKWMNQYPIIFLTLKEVEGQTFEEAFTRLRSLIAGFCRKHEYLLGSDRLSASRKRVFEDLMVQDAEPARFTENLKVMTEVFCTHWGKPAIVLIDEYDVPLESARKHGYLDAMIPLIRRLLGAALKTNDYLNFAVVTGCLRISRESIFTGLNNFSCFTVSDPWFADKFGFTPQEVGVLLEESGFADRFSEMQTWYDGYRFGDGQEIYCPWDVIQHVSALRRSSSARPQTYWKNTSGNAIVREFLDMPQFNISSKVETLLKGGCIPVRVVEEITYQELYSSEDNLWSVLFLTGYLTKASKTQLEAAGIVDTEDVSWLTIPNREIMSILPEILQQRFNQNIQRMDRQTIFKAFWSGDDVYLSDQLSALLLRTISYYDYQENFYHAFLAGIFSGAGYEVMSNREAGTGRSDIIILDRNNSRSAVIEVKHADSYESMENDALAALKQIADKRYDAGIPRGFKELLHWGVAFNEKDAIAKVHLVKS